MTPDRRALANRLSVQYQHATPSGKIGLCGCGRCIDLRNAGAALREDADMPRRTVAETKDGPWVEGRSARSYEGDVVVSGRLLESLCERLRDLTAANAKLLDAVENDAEYERASDGYRRLRGLILAATPEHMGGTPDLFAPEVGWDAWESEVWAVLMEHDPFVVRPSRPTN